MATTTAANFTVGSVVVNFGQTAKVVGLFVSASGFPSDQDGWPYPEVHRGQWEAERREVGRRPQQVQGGGLMAATVVNSYCPACRRAELHIILPDGPQCKRCLINGCYYGLTAEDACIYCGEPKRTFQLIGKSPIQALAEYANE